MQRRPRKTGHCPNMRAPIVEQWQPEPVTIMDEPRTARLTMPAPTAPFLARTSRQTAPLVLKPPSLGKYLYWDSRATGHKLDYRKRKPQTDNEWDYLYLGFWSTADMLAILTELPLDDAIRVFRTEANRNAKLYLKRKEERKNG